MKVLLLAGGTGGHLSPALALAQKLKEESTNFFILSTARATDKTFAAQSDAIWMCVDVKPFTPLWRWLSPSFTLKQGKAFARIWRALRRLRPDVVVGFGSYLSAIGVPMSRMLRIPVILHEQNVIPGKANRWLAPWVSGMAVSFSETKRYFSRRLMVEVTGNPLRWKAGSISRQEARSYFRFDDIRPVLLVMGGSQGSQAINRIVLSMWRQVSPQDRYHIQVLHITGFEESQYAQELYRELGMEARVFSFLKEMPAAYAAATLAIGRAGATAIAEMVAAQVPAILIPYPYAGGHQRANALWMEQAGGALAIEQDHLTPQRLWQEIAVLLSASSDRLVRMRVALTAHKDGTAVDKLRALMERVAG